MSITDKYQKISDDLGRLITNINVVLNNKKKKKMETLLTIQADESQKINDQNDAIKRQKQINELKSFIDHWHKFDKCYFWTSPSSASSRRYEEKRQYMEINLTIDGHEIDGEIEISCSCKNYYATKTLYIDGDKKTIRALNKFLK